MNWLEYAEKWQQHNNLDLEMQEQLATLTDKEKEEAFHKHLEFGTGGLRGELGPGINRLNLYTVRRATEGLAKYIVECGEEAIKRGVVIAYDCRHKSPEFSIEVARTLGKYGIKVYVFEELRPTPELSFAVRELKAFIGVMITASHNPPEYNGYKVYGEDGGQLPPEAADRMLDYMAEIECELQVGVAEESVLREQGLLVTLGKEMDDLYIEQLKSIVQNQEMVRQNGEKLSVVFTPLHGTANIPVQRILKETGFSNVTVVKEQELPDPNFTTVKSPNPEEHSAFEYAIRYGNEVEADILLATDPDCDRLGVAVKNNEGEYVVLTGNQTGALLLHYLLKYKKENNQLPENGIVLKTIVTSEIGRAIAESFGMVTEDVLTGFKFIGEKIAQYEKNNKHTFLFGYEESYGYLISEFVRDKDAVQAALLACEVALSYKLEGKSLYDGLLEIFEQYGFYQEGLVSMTMKGLDGANQIKNMMNHFRTNPPLELAGIKVLTVEDYAAQTKRILTSNEEVTLELPTSNVLKYYLEDESWFCLRPSGTEPKIKFYFSVMGTSLEAVVEKLEELKKEVLSIIE